MCQRRHLHPRVRSRETGIQSGRVPKIGQSCRAQDNFGQLHFDYDAVQILGKPQEQEKRRRRSPSNFSH